MTKETDYIGVESIAHSINHLTEKVETLSVIRERLRELEHKADKVYVEDRPDSSLIHVRVEASEPLEEMRELANTSQFLTGSSTTKPALEYRFNEGMYVLEKKFRTDS